MKKINLKAVPVAFWVILGAAVVAAIWMLVLGG